MKSLSIYFIGILSLNAHAQISNKVIAGNVANGCFLQGQIIDSDGALDIGISGTGWLPLQKSNGEIVYSRYGSLGMNGDGFLVQRPSKLPVVTVNDEGKFQKIDLASKATISFFRDRSRLATMSGMLFREDGSLEAFYSDGQSLSIAQLNLATFENQRELKLLDRAAHLFSAPPSVGEVGYGKPLTGPFGKIFSRSLEEAPSDRYSKSCD